MRDSDIDIGGEPRERRSAEDRHNVAVGGSVGAGNDNGDELFEFCFVSSSSASTGPRFFTSHPQVHSAHNNKPEKTVRVVLATDGPPPPPSSACRLEVHHHSTHKFLFELIVDLLGCYCVMP
jgi:hypothetical protein